MDGNKMAELNKHPLYAAADRLKRALMLSGFQILKDDHAEIVETGKMQELMQSPQDSFAPVLLEDCAYGLRNSLLCEYLPELSAENGLKAAVCGIAYDAQDQKYPLHVLLEGVIAEKEITYFEMKDLWDRIVREAYGAAASCEIASGKIIVKYGENEFELGKISQASWIAGALLGIREDAAKAYIFRIDADAEAMRFYGLENRAKLYSVLRNDLIKICDDTPSFGGTFKDKTRDIMRRNGYLEFIGERAYTEDAYKRMNMIQESWDTNNQALKLKEPLAGYESELTPCTERSGLPTVLTPSLEQAMYENWKSGEKEVRLFEINHIYKPAGRGMRPWEKTSLSFGLYGENADIRMFRQETDRILNELGVKNHFFIPTGMAIAYKTDECLVILDEKMKYLDGNCGHISQAALNNYRIGTHAFMAQFELDTIEGKAAAEYGFVPYEMRDGGDRIV